MMSINEMEQLVKDLKSLKSERESLDEKIGKLESAIKDEMTATSTYEYAGDDWKVTWNMVSSNRFDQKSFKDEHPDMFEQYKKLSESRRFLLS